MKKELKKELTIHEFDDLKSNTAMAYKYDNEKNKYVLLNNKEEEKNHDL
jgi:hypothetical protein